MGSDDRDWANGLPAEITSSIARRLPVPDYLRLQAVCTSWDCALKNDPFNPPMPSEHFPWLGLTRLDDERSIPCFRGSPADGRLCYKLPLVPAGHVARWVGSRGGWLVFMEYAKHERLVHLVNPITGAFRSLPPLSRVPREHIKQSSADKIVLSPAISSVAIYRNRGGHLAFARPGDDAWKPLPRPPGSTYDPIVDVIHHRGQFVSVSDKGRYHTYDPSGLIPKMGTMVIPDYHFPREYGDYYNNLYLASTPSGDLLTIYERYSPSASSSARNFTVVKFGAEAGDSGWVEIKSLGDSSMFLDKYHSICMTTRDVPELRRNCIYFAGRYYHPSEDAAIHGDGVEYCSYGCYANEMGVYDIESGVCEPYRIPKEFGPLGDSTLPIWFTPSLS